MAKSKSADDERALRAVVVGQAARLAASSGEEMLTIAAGLRGWLDGSELAVEHALPALVAAVAEAAERHEHLRGRRPGNLASVLSRADELGRFIAGEPETLV